MKVYIVESACGDYEDYRTVIEGVFKTRESAERFARDFKRRVIPHASLQADPEDFEDMKQEFVKRYERPDDEYEEQIYDELLDRIEHIADREDYFEVIRVDTDFINFLSVARETLPEIEIDEESFANALRAMSATSYYGYDYYYPCNITEFTVND